MCVCVRVCVCVLVPVGVPVGSLCYGFQGLQGTSFSAKSQLKITEYRDTPSEACLSDVDLKQVWS